MEILLSKGGNRVPASLIEVQLSLDMKDTKWENVRVYGYVYYVAGFVLVDVSCMRVYVANTHFTFCSRFFFAFFYLKFVDLRMLLRFCVESKKLTLKGVYIIFYIS